MLLIPPTTTDVDGETGSLPGSDVLAGTLPIEHTPGDNVHFILFGICCGGLTHLLTSGVPCVPMGTASLFPAINVLLLTVHPASQDWVPLVRRIWTCVGTFVLVAPSRGGVFQVCLHLSSQLKLYIILLDA